MSWEERLENAGPFGEDQRVELVALLKSESLLSAFAFILQENDLSTTAFTQFNFSDPSDVVKATRLQGRIAGILHVVERLFELGEEDGRDS